MSMKQFQMCQNWSQILKYDNICQTRVTLGNIWLNVIKGRILGQISQHALFSLGYLDA